MWHAFSTAEAHNAKVFAEWLRGQDETIRPPTAEEAGVPWIGFHTFRHTCATRLFADGRNAVQVQRWLGHHSPAFTLSVYVDLLNGDVGDPLSSSIDELRAVDGNVERLPLPAAAA